VDTQEQRLRQLRTWLNQGVIDRETYDREVARTLAVNGSASVGLSSLDGLPARVGMYEILGTLGRGGMGIVYRARHRLDAERRQQRGEVALKVLAPEIARRPGYEARFLEEANLGIALRHPGIVRVLDTVQDGDALAVAMELVAGETLADRLDRAGPIPWARAMPGVQRFLDAVAFAHGAGVIHRDLKPDNVIVRPDGGWVVLDFGIARQEGRDRHTATGTALGTLDYMAPEQHEDSSRVDVRADVYGLGMTLYHVLAGRLPWSDKAGMAEVITRKNKRSFGPPTAHYPAIPREVARTVMAALAPRPDDRPSSVEEFASRLGLPLQERAETMKLPPGWAPSRKPRRRRRSRMSMLLTLLVLAVLLGALGLWPGVEPGGEPEVTPPTADVVEAVTSTSPAPTSTPAPTPVATAEPAPAPPDGPMVEVPAGPFWMGCSESDAYCERDERPGRAVTLPTFWIERTEVTVEAYGACVAAGECGRPKSGSDAYNWGKRDRALHPVNGVSWRDARTYCRWKGWRLPTEAEWEKAARGSEASVFPWGDAPATCGLAVMDDGGDGCGRDTTWPVGSKRTGASPCGALDMAGNVWEWTADWYDDEYYSSGPVTDPKGPGRGETRVARGGSFDYYGRVVRAGNRHGAAPKTRLPDLGFRCAR